MKDAFTLEMLEQLVADFEREHGSLPASDPSITWEFRSSRWLPDGQVYIMDYDAAPLRTLFFQRLGPRFIIMARRELTKQEQLNTIALYFKKLSEAE